MWSVEITAKVFPNRPRYGIMINSVWNDQLCILYIQYCKFAFIFWNIYKKGWTCTKVFGNKTLDYKQLSEMFHKVICSRVVPVCDIISKLIFSFIFLLYTLWFKNCSVFFEVRQKMHAQHLGRQCSFKVPRFNWKKNLKKICLAKSHFCSEHNVKRNIKFQYKF